MATLRLAAVCAALVVGGLAARVGLRDRDGDGIADRYDPFPDDAERPGRADPDTIYANTSAELYRIDDGGKSIRRIGPFSFSDGLARSVTDIAVDPWGVMWASSFDAIMVCDPHVARCEVLASTTASLNALEHARTPTGDEAAYGVDLYAASTSGGLYRVDRRGRVERIGELGGPSSGDLVPHGEFIGAARDDPGGVDTLVAFDATDLARRDVARLPDTEIYGLARCDDHRALAFDASGWIYRADGAGSVADWKNVGHPNLAWWGASCSPRVFGLPGEQLQGEAPPAAPSASDERDAEDRPAVAPSEGRRSWCGGW